MIGFLIGTWVAFICVVWAIHKSTESNSKNWKSTREDFYDVKEEVKRFERRLKQFECELLNTTIIRLDKLDGGGDSHEYGE